MAEEFRFFLRTGLYVAIAGAVYWFVTSEPAGTVLLLALVLGVAVFVVVGRFLAPRLVRETTSGGVLGALNRIIGFHERPEDPAPLEGGPELVPLASAWPIVTAAGAVVIGLGLIFGAWLLVPGLLVLAAGVLGWITQLDRVA